MRRDGAVMRLVVTGAKGQIGSELACSLTALGDVVALDRQQCDLLRPERLSALIRSLKPDVVVNAAAYTAVNDAELAKSAALVLVVVTTAAPRVLAFLISAR